MNLCIYHRVQQDAPVDEDGDGQGHGEDEEQDNGNHLVDGDGLCQREGGSLHIQVDLLQGNTLVH